MSKQVESTLSLSSFDVRQSGDSGTQELTIAGEYLQSGTPVRTSLDSELFLIRRPFKVLM